MHSIIKINKFFLCLTVIIILFANRGFGTKYAGDFQELIVGGRICGMGGSGVAQSGDPSYIVLNPASLMLSNKSLHLMHAENFAGIVKNEFGAIVIPKANITYGIGFQMVSVNNIKLTTLPDTTKNPGDENIPIPYDTVSTRDMVFYLNAGKTRNIFSYGVNLKIYYRDLAVLTGIGGGIDIGLKLNLRNLNAGFSIRDFVLAPIYWKSDTKEYISPKITLGIAPKIPLTRINAVLIIESDIVKDLSFNNLLLNNGIEIAYKNKIFGRLGISGDRYTAGVGLRYKKLVFDYGLITHEDLGISNKFSACIEF
uniref:PorV/PorQ family protein n=1 Tax=candidate division WOR-3 bacterium TaxID=2052148 RepID=A0A7V0Z3Y3_UNCW3